MNLIGQYQDVEFFVTKEFDYSYLAPINENVTQKLKMGWDDYNEFNHCLDLLEILFNENKSIQEYHLAKKAEEIVGVALVSSSVDKTSVLSEDYKQLSDDDILLNYFHISANNRGFGKKWFSEYILPYYRQIGKERLYVKSSHPKAFSLYERFGIEYAEYQRMSDNDKYVRQGKEYCINL